MDTFFFVLQLILGFVTACIVFVGFLNLVDFINSHKKRKS